MKDYQILKLPNSVAKPVIVANHYSKSYPNAMKNNFGLFFENKLVGLICYGKPHSHTLRAGIAGKTYSNKILELSRLWIANGEPKNTASWLISHTLKLLRNCDIVVSFADPDHDHVGIVYQAANWLYTGLGTTVTALVPKGHEGHHLKAIYGLNKADLIEKYGADNLERRTINGKHRYLYIINKKQEEIILKRLKYPIIPYPKKNPC